MFNVVDEFMREAIDLFKPAPVNAEYKKNLQALIKEGRTLLDDVLTEDDEVSRKLVEDTLKNLEEVQTGIKEIKKFRESKGIN